MSDPVSFVGKSLRQKNLDGVHRRSDDHVADIRRRRHRRRRRCRVASQERRHDERRDEEAGSDVDVVVVDQRRLKGRLMMFNQVRHFD